MLKALIIFLKAQILLAQTPSSNDLETFANYINSLNEPTLAETAGSMGSFGTELSLGATNVEKINSNRLLQSELGLSAKQNPPTYMPKAWIQKGLPWPINVNIFGGVPNDTDLHHYGASVQWTVFEGFQMPAVAARYIHARTGGFKNTKVRSNTFSASVSYGLFSYFQFFGDISRTETDIDIFVDAQSPISFLIEEIDAKSDEVKVRMKSESMAVGCKIAVIPGVVTAAVETRNNSDSTSSSTFKLSTFF